MNFFGPNFFGNISFFWTENILDTIFFYPILSIAPKNLGPTFLKFLFTLYFLNPKSYWSKNIFGPTLISLKLIWTSNFVLDQIPNLSLYFYLYQGPCIAPLLSFLYVGFLHKIYVPVYIYISDIDRHFFPDPSSSISDRLQIGQTGSTHSLLYLAVLQ